MAVSTWKVTMPLNQSQNEYFNTLNDFRSKEMFCDVALEVEGKIFPCHRLVLIAASTYFQTMFNGNFKESNSKTVVIEGIKAEVMDDILNAIYTASIVFTPQNAYFILKASHLLHLNRIVDACVAYIAENRYIHYLIDTCSFAEIVNLKELLAGCIQVIADNLASFAKTDSFGKISYEVLNSILSSECLVYKQDEKLMAIIKWAKSNPGASKIHRLMESLEFPCPAASVIAKLVEKNDISFANEPSNQNEDDVERVSNLSFNLYLNTIDKKTGAVGWSLLNLDDSFKFNERTTLSNFHPLNSFSTEFCRVGTKIYCLESNPWQKKLEFSCYKNEEKTIRNSIPNDLNWNSKYGMVAMDSTVVLFDKRASSSIWAYDSASETMDDEPTWNKIFEQSNPFSKNALYSVTDCLTATALDDVLYVIGARSPTYPRRILAFDRRTPRTRNAIKFPTFFDFEYASVCTFGGKIYICGSNHGGTPHNTFYVFDVNANRFLSDVKPMKNRQINQKLIYGDGYIYSVGNRPFMMNEKYNIKSNMWTDLPSLPYELPVKDSENVLSINYVHFAEVCPRL